MNEKLLNMIKNKKGSDYFCSVLWGVLGLLTFLFIWTIVSTWNDSFILPSPFLVLKKIWQLIFMPQFWKSGFSTFCRVFVSFLITAVVSFFCGLWWGLDKRALSFFSPLLTGIKSTPVISLILLAVFWFGSTSVPVFASCLMTFPLLTESIISEISLLPSEYKDLSQVYNLSFKRKVLNLFIPWFLPVYISTGKTVLAQTWKIIVAAEVISMPKNGIGSALQLAKNHIEIEEVFAWTVSIVFLSGLVELLYYFLTKPWRKTR